MLELLLPPIYNILAQLQKPPFTMQIGMKSTSDTPVQNDIDKAVQQTPALSLLEREDQQALLHLSSIFSSNSLQAALIKLEAAKSLDSGTDPLVKGIQNLQLVALKKQLRTQRLSLIESEKTTLIATLKWPKSQSSLNWEEDEDTSELDQAIEGLTQEVEKLTAQQQDLQSIENELDDTNRQYSELEYKLDWLAELLEEPGKQEQLEQEIEKLSQKIQQLTDQQKISSVSAGSEPEIPENTLLLIHFDEEEDEGAEDSVEIQIAELEGTRAALEKKLDFIKTTTQAGLQQEMDQLESKIQSLKTEKEALELAIDQQLSDTETLIANQEKAFSIQPMEETTNQKNKLTELREEIRILTQQQEKSQSHTATKSYPFSIESELTQACERLLQRNLLNPYTLKLLYQMPTCASDLAETLATLAEEEVPFSIRTGSGFKFQVYRICSILLEWVSDMLGFPSKFSRLIAPYKERTALEIEKVSLERKIADLQTKISRFQGEIDTEKEVSAKLAMLESLNTEQDDSDKELLSPEQDLTPKSEGIIKTLNKQIIQVQEELDTTQQALEAIIQKLAKMAPDTRSKVQLQPTQPTESEEDSKIDEHTPMLSSESPKLKVKSLADDDEESDDDDNETVFFSLDGDEVSERDQLIADSSDSEEEDSGSELKGSSGTSETSIEDEDGQNIRPSISSSPHSFLSNSRFSPMADQLKKLPFPFPLSIR